MTLIGRIWRRLKQAYVFVLPLRFNLFAIAMLLFAFRFSDQGQDILRALADKENRPKMEMVRFIFISNALAWQIWYWSRHLLRYRPNTKENDSGRDPIRDPLPSDPELRGLTRWLPRLLGLVVFLVEIGGFIHTTTSLEGAAILTIFGLLPSAVWWLAASAVVYLVFVVKRRDVFQITDDKRFDRAGVWRDFNRVARALLVFAAIIELACFVWAYRNPVSWSALGVAATLVLTITVWIPLGTFTIALATRLRFPIGTALLVWAFLISPYADNHGIRNSGATNPAKRPTIDSAFEAWYQRVKPLHPNGPVPVIIVATEGGGIRAAYWTATALTSVTDQLPAFKQHCFAVSGVSGGSLGALIYNAILTRRLDHPGIVTTAQADVRAMLRHDALSGTLAALAQPDLLQRFVPAAILPDRQRALEEGWEVSWVKGDLGDNLFSKPLLATMSAHPTLPNLFLNGTVVETGERIITTNVQLHPTLLFRNAFDAIEEMKLDLPMSSAAGMSARFTYVSPAGKIPFTRGSCNGARMKLPCSTKEVADPDCGRALFGHVVDGGYFENSGAVTAAEVVVSVMDYAKRKDYKVIPLVIVIDQWNDVTDANCPGSPKHIFCPAPNGLGPNPPAKAERYANEVLSPLRGVLAARDARGKEAVGDIAQLMGDSIVELRLAPPLKEPTPLPLGWILSDKAMTQIDNAMTSQHGNQAAIDALRAFIATAQTPTLRCATERCVTGEGKGSSYGD